jgi:L-ascorbate metabolism protein UlaG (beta-lactamase superfamily)
MIQPFQKDDDFLADVAAAPHGSLHLWWLGQSGFLVRWENRHLLFDPYLSDSLTKKYASTDKPHVRMTERVIAPERLDFADIVTSSHNHTDHLDAETLQPLFTANPDTAFVVPEANRAFAAERAGLPAERLFGLDDGKSAIVRECEFHGIAAAHNTVERDGQGRCKFLGYVVRIGPWTLYHSGDTLWHDGLAPALERFAIDVAFLPINGNRPERRVAGNLDGREAAELAHRVGVRLVIPCHYEMFAFNTEPPDLFVSTCRQRGQLHYVMHAGERLSLPAR